MLYEVITFMDFSCHLDFFDHFAFCHGTPVLFYRMLNFRINFIYTKLKGVFIIQALEYF